MFGFHMQLPTNNWLDAVARLPAGTPVKAVNDGGMLVEAKQRNPGVFTVLRQWFGDQYTFGGSLEENKQRARAFFATFIDDTFMSAYAPHIDAIEEFNEYSDDRHVPNTQREWMKVNLGLNYNPEFLAQEYQDRLTWVKAVNEVWTNEYRTRPGLGHIRLVTGNVPIGNSIPLEFARIVQQHGGLLGYHPYIYTQNGQVDPGDDLNLSGRWRPNDAYFKANGVKVDWIGTEGGVYGSVIDGWRSSGVCGGNLECYLDALRYFCDRAATWNQQNGNRWRGFVLFTTLRVNDQQWGGYHVQQPEMNTLAELAAQYPIGGTIPPPEPPPVPPPVPPPTGDNMLPNHSFEEGWYHIDGRPELQIAADWFARWKEDSGFVTPEFRVLPKSQVPPGEHDLFFWDGDQTIKAFKGGLPIHFKYYTQAFNVPAGDYKLTVNLFPDLVDRYENGQKVYAPQGAAEVRLYWNGVQGAWVHPRPGERVTLVFDWQHEGGPAEVGLDFRCADARQNNGFFFDAWILEAVTEPPPPPPPPPPPGECRGAPRVQYSRTYQLIHGSVPDNVATAIFQAGLPNKRTTGYSADDAGIGDLDVRHVDVFGWPENERAGLVAWYAQHYPGVTVAFKSLPAPGGFQLAADVSQHQGDIEWETMRAKMQDEGLE